MRWKIKEPIKYGNKRVIKRFAFLPKKIGSERVWLERYYVEQEYDWDVGILSPRNNFWRDIKFEVISRGER